MSNSSINLSLGSIEGQNLGSGAGVFAQKISGNTLQFKSIAAGANIQLITGATEITISGSTGGGGGGGGISAAENGLITDGTTVRLGGSLTGNTTIDPSTFGILFGSGEASGSGSFGQGINVCAVGDRSHAEGCATCAQANGSHAEGRASRAYGIYSHSEGCLTQACGQASHVEGRFSISCGSFSHAQGCGSISFGNGSDAQGGSTFACGIYSHSEGSTTCAIGACSHSEGQNTIASGDSSHAEGNATNAVGNFSHAEGFETCAIAGSSHSEGTCTCSVGSNSHSEGRITCSLGTNSHSEGNLTIACGVNSHSEGSCTCAIGGCSHSEGFFTEAYGTASHAQGVHTCAIGDNSVTSGCGSSTRKLFACGLSSFNHSTNNGSQISGHGANAPNSSILGGQNHNIESGNNRAAIIGGNGIKLTSTDYIDTTAMGCVAIFQTPTTVNTNKNALVWNSTSKKVELNDELDGFIQRTVYNPSTTGVTNITSVSVPTTSYTIQNSTGNTRIITIFGTLTPNPTAADVITEFRLSLPIGDTSSLIMPNTASMYEFVNNVIVPVQIVSDSNLPLFRYRPPFAAATRSITYSFSYVIEP